MQQYELWAYFQFDLLVLKFTRPSGGLLTLLHPFNLTFWY